MSDVISKHLNDVFEQRNEQAAALNAEALSTIAQNRAAFTAQHPDLDWNDENWNGFLEFMGEADDFLEGQGIKGFEEHFQNEDGTPHTAKIKAFTHAQDILLTVQTYSSIMSERAYETDTEESVQELQNAIHEMKDLGYSVDDAVAVIKSIKIGKAATVHPTEHLNKTGIGLSQELVAVAELPPAQREKAFQDIIAKMAANPIGATRKSTIMDEIDGSNATARIHNQGCSNLERHIGNFFVEAYGKRPEVKIDIGMKSWDYDSDGKNNAEGWAMLTKMATTTMGSFDDILAALDTVPEGTNPKAAAETRKAIEDAKANLQPVYRRAREVVTNLAGMAPRQREDYYRAQYEELKQKTEEFSHIYDDSDSKNYGRDTYTHVLYRLDLLRKELIDTDHEDSYIAIDNAFRDARRNGLVLEKGQTRQNDIIHARIIDNFFNSNFLRSQNILSAQKIIQIDKNGGISKLSTEAQYEIYQQVINFADKNGNREVLLRAMFDANRLDFEKDGNGYPKQERTLLDRFALRKLYPMKFDQAIISDATEAAVPHQKFLGDLFGMKDMRHMPLFEDRKNLARIGDLSEIFHKHGGQDGVKTRHHKSQKNRVYNWYYSGRDIYDLPLMVPCSDSTRGAGSAALMETTNEIRKVVRNAYALSEQLSIERGKDIGQAFAIMIGGGLSMGRFGADVGYMRRVIEQEVKNIAIERGRPFDRNNDADNAFLRMSSAILYTEQGRAKRMLTATPNQVTDDYARRITEIIHGRFDLEGLVPDNTFIEPKFEFTNPAMEAIQEEAWKIAIGGYVEQRFQETAESIERNKGRLEKDREPSYVLDDLAKTITCSEIIAYLNNGARPGAKKTGDRKMTGVRAIENDKRNNVAEIFTSGHGMGAVMQFLQSKVDDGTINQNDIKELFQHPEWDFLMFTKEVANANRINYAYADKQLDSAKGDVSEQRVYLEKFKADHAMFVNALDNSVDVKTAFPAAMEIAKEHKNVLPGLTLFRMVSNHIAKFPAKERAAAIEDLGGDAFIRSLGSVYNSGTAPHYPLFMGIKNAYTHNQPDLELTQIMTPKARNVLGLNNGETPEIQLN